MFAASFDVADGQIDGFVVMRGSGANDGFPAALVGELVLRLDLDIFVYSPDEAVFCHDLLAIYWAQW